MKRYLALALAAFALVLAAPSAFAINLRVADPPSHIVCGSNTPCNIVTLGDIYQVAFVPCSTDGIPPGDAADHFSWCLWMHYSNDSETAATGMAFTLKVPDGGSWDDSNVANCSDTGFPEGTVVSITCPSGPQLAGDLLTISLNINPGFASGNDFFLYTDFLTQTAPDPADVTLSVPEPGELGLFGLGLLALGVGYGRQRRRHRPQSNDAG